MAECKVKITAELDIPEKTLVQCFRIIEIWLENNPDKTVIIEDEEGVRVLLIADREGKHAEKEQGV